MAGRGEIIVLCLVLKTNCPSSFTFDFKIAYMFRIVSHIVAIMVIALRWFVKLVLDMFTSLFFLILFYDLT